MLESTNVRPHCGANPGRLLTDLIHTLGQEPFEQAVVLGVADSAEGSISEAAGTMSLSVDLLVASVGEDHPERFLLGFRAPQPWWALGVVAPARAYHPGGVSLCSVVAFAWAGGVLSSVQRHCPQKGPTATLVDVGAPGGGWLADLLRRGLGFPTEPSSIPLNEVMNSLWFDAILATAAKGLNTLQWPDLVAHHPAAGLLGGSIGLLPPAQFGKRAAQATAQLGAAGVHQLGISGELSANNVPHDLATWFDAGAFNRWLAQELPPAGSLLEDVVELLAPRCAAALRTAYRHTDPTRTCTPEATTSQFSATR